MVPSVLVLVLLAVAFVVGRFSTTWWAPANAEQPAAPGASAAHELAEREAFIEQLRELAWQHRDVSPELSTILLDEIAIHHRRLSGPHD